MNENLEGEESILDCLSNQGVLDVYVVRGKVRVRWRTDTYKAQDS